MTGVEKDFMLELQIPPTNFKVGDEERNPVILQASCELTSTDEQKKVFKFEKNL